MRRHAWSLDAQQKDKLAAYMAKFAGLEPIYQFKQQLSRLLLIKKQTARECRTLIPKLISMIKQLQQAHFQPLVALGKTFRLWLEELVCMWRFTKNNGITEGFHRKMKLIQRRAYGFKNFENYRLRVRALCC